MSGLADVAVIGFEQAPTVAATDGTTNGVEMLVPVFSRLLSGAGITKADVGFWCSGSSDYLAGRAFSFVSAVDAIGAFPPIVESHVEADAAWALYEAWLKLRMGEAQVALVYGFGKSSAGRLRQVLTLQTDPYTVAPLWPDSIGLAGLQARAGLDVGAWTEKDMARVAVRSRAAAAANPAAQLGGVLDVDDLLAEPYLADPLRRHDIAPVGDGAAAVLLAAGDRARELVAHPAWIRGIAHQVESAHLGVRDLVRSPSTTAAAAAAGGVHGVQIAELHAPFTHQELVLGQALGLPDDVAINPSGGALTGNPMFAAGLVRIGEAARHVLSGDADRVLAHATQGPLLQHNLVTVMEAR
ncbi:thiolase domain-containing protein [Spongisporangium articulatum]|uniref:Thiolase domain-containing protein n=1 Tax=Spongisporangium articulatum TaxID=3362603 RepID=A0ABW8ATR5_9ACTN